MLHQQFLPLELKLSTSSHKVVKKYSYMCVSAVPRHYFRSFCIDTTSEKTFKKAFFPPSSTVQLFLLIQP